MSDKPRFRNRILASLPHDELNMIEPYLFRTTMVVSQVLFEKGIFPDTIYFIEEGFVALVADVGSGDTMQIAITGSEGVRGTFVAYKPERFTNYASIVQISGPVYKMKTVDFLNFIEISPNLRRECTNYVSDFVQQIGQTSACNAKHEMTKRLCRLLLMAHDRSTNNDILLTHNQLARMIGVRRAGVTGFMANLQSVKIIQQTRGRITVLDRKLLREHSCSCYDVMQLFKPSAGE